MSKLRSCIIERNATPIHETALPSHTFNGALEEQVQARALSFFNLHVRKA